MFGCSSFYGHVNILSRYCGFDTQLAIPGFLQHGWAPELGFSKEIQSGVWRKFVWNDENFSAAKGLGQSKNTFVIGAPFLYLLQIEPHLQESQTPETESSLLAAPFHGWERESLSGNFDSYMNDLKRLRADGFKPIRVCLYWYEYQNPQLRSTFEDAGFEVFTAGHRENNPEFLMKLAKEIRRHAFVTSNRIGTISFLALILKRRFFRFGDWPLLKGEGDEQVSKLKNRFQNLEFPTSIHKDHLGLAEAELGADFLRTPEELKELFLCSKKDFLKRFYWHLRAKAGNFLR